MELTGAEDVFDTRPWDTAVNAVNCYDYAIGDFERQRNVKSTPGNRAGMNSNGLNFTTCKGLRERILSDNPKTVYYMPDADKPCKPGYYRMMNFVSPNGGDFHFYKQIKAVRYKVKSGDTEQTISKFFRVPMSTIKNLNIKANRVIVIPVNLWAHKQGWGAPPLLTDAKGKTIKDPRKASRNYPGLNYSRYCGCYGVRKDHAGSGSLSLPGLRSKNR